MYVCSLGEVCFSKINADVPNEVSPSPAPMTGATTSTPGFERGAVSSWLWLFAKTDHFFATFLNLLKVTIPYNSLPYNSVTGVFYPYKWSYGPLLITIGSGPSLQPCEKNNSAQVKFGSSPMARGKTNSKAQTTRNESERSRVKLP